MLRGWVNTVTVAIEKRLGKGGGKNNESGKDDGESGGDLTAMKSTSVDNKEGGHYEVDQDPGLVSVSSSEQSLTTLPHSPSACYSLQPVENIPPPPTLADFPSPYSIDGHVSKGKQWQEMEKTPQGYTSNGNDDSRAVGGLWLNGTFSNMPGGVKEGVYVPDGMVSPHVVMSSLSSPRTVFKACVEELTERQNTSQF